MKAFCVFGLCVAALILSERPSAAQSPGNLRQLFGDLDANGDGVIDPNEVPEDGRKAFERLLKRADSNKNGKLEAEEYRSLFQQVRESLNDDPAINAFRQRLASMDKNGDGKIERKEFTGSEEVFKRLDRDNDGVLTPSERPGGNLEPASSNLPPALRRLDQNNDGKVDRKEFPGRPAVFSRLDKNGDGTLSAQELKSAAGPLGPPATRDKKSGKKP